MAQTTTPPEHPSPHRERVSLISLLFGLAAAPFAWSVAHVVGYGLAGYSCDSLGAQRAQAIQPSTGAPQPGLVLLMLAALLLAATGGWTAWRAREATKHEGSNHRETLMEAGEGRSRFLAMSGLLMTVLFTAAIIFDAIVLLGAPVCRD